MLQLEANFVLGHCLCSVGLAIEGKLHLDTIRKSKQLTLICRENAIEENILKLSKV